MLPTTFAIRLRKGYGGQEATAVKMWKCCRNQYQLSMKGKRR